MYNLTQPEQDAINYVKRRVNAWKTFLESADNETNEIKKGRAKIVVNEILGFDIEEEEHSLLNTLARREQHSRP